MVSDFLSWVNVTKQPITTGAVNGEGGECRRYLQFDLWWIKTNSWRTHFRGHFC
ncbi:unnamed protein product [Sphagnum jensenii]|uniref:Uncharacterized protein n=1 Tax=Sphagnum jensenii TaxID=128206 RepID=A0ABP1BXP1_9BRYO